MGRSQRMQELKEELVGKPITVTVTDVDPRQRRFTCSERTADYMKRLNAIKCAAAHDCYARSFRAHDSPQVTGLTVSWLVVVGWAV